MKYIKENYKNSAESGFTLDELEIIKPFISDLVNNIDVECIFLLATYVDKRITKEPNDYCKVEISVILDEKNISKTIDKLMETGNKLDCMQDPINTFVLQITEREAFEEIRSKTYPSIEKKDLVSSYIIYDKNGTYEELQDKLKTSIKPWGGLSKLLNINELDVKKENSMDNINSQIDSLKALKKLVEEKPNEHNTGPKLIKKK